MGFKAIKINRNLTRTILVDNRSEIDDGNLPTNDKKGIGGLTNTDNGTLAIGSIAICLEDKTKWILSPSNIWTQLPSAGGGSGSSDDTDMDYITQEEIDSIIDSL